MIPVLDTVGVCGAQAAAFDAKRVVVAWWGEDITDLAASMAAFAPRAAPSMSSRPKSPRCLKTCWTHLLLPGAVLPPLAPFSQQPLSPGDADPALQQRRAWGC